MESGGGRGEVGGAEVVPHGEDGDRGAEGRVPLVPVHPLQGTLVLLPWTAAGGV